MIRPSFPNPSSVVPYQYCSDNIIPYLAINFYSVKKGCFWRCKKNGWIYVRAIWHNHFIIFFFLDSHSPALLDLFISSDASICSTMAFPPLGNSDHAVVSVSIDFPSYSQRDAPFHRIPYDYFRGDWDGLFDHLRDVP